MEVMPGVEIVGTSPALYLRKYKALIIADVHIGYEDELASKGIYLPRFQLRRTLDLIERLLNELQVDRLIIAGDLKHSFDRLNHAERRELATLFSHVIPRVEEVIVVRGNHDNYLPILKRRFDFKLEESFTVGEYLIIHGHKTLPEGSAGSWDYLILGHEHPSITLRDSVGRLGKFPCFLVGKLRSAGKPFITLPATGAYQTGSRITLTPDTYISPVLKHEAVIHEIKPIIVDEDVGVFELPSLMEIADYIF
ncbi:MAG: metallophosphoesterase [Zestosphaera sp.]